MDITRPRTLYGSDSEPQGKQTKLVNKNIKLSKEPFSVSVELGSDSVYKVLCWTSCYCEYFCPVCVVRVCYDPGDM